jgi:hypothetical protein
MRRLLKFTALVSVLLFSFSLCGCASNDHSQKQTKNEVKTNEAAKQTEQLKVPIAETTNEQTTNQSTELASPETKEKNTEQATTKPNSNAKNTKTNQANSSANQVNTNTSVNQSKAAVAPPIEPSTPPPSTTPPTQKPAEAVTLSVVGPKDRGTIIGATKVSFKDGETIFDILLRESKQHNIIVDYDGSGATTYIYAIDNISASGKNGWVFKVNGVSITKSSGIIKVKDGDRIECFYTE